MKGRSIIERLSRIVDGEYEDDDGDGEYEDDDGDVEY